MTEAEIHRLEPGQHVFRKPDHHELQVLEVEPTNEVFAFDLVARKAVHVSAYLLEPKVVAS